MENDYLQFAEIVARNFPEYTPPAETEVNETPISHITLAYIPGVGRLDMLIIPEGDEFYG